MVNSIELYGKIEAVLVFSVLLISGCIEGQTEQSFSDVIDTDKYTLYENKGVRFYYPNSATITGTTIGLEQTLAVFHLNRGNINVQKFELPVDAGYGEFTDEDCQAFVNDIVDQFQLTYGVQTVNVISARSDMLGEMSACKFTYEATMENKKLGFTQYTTLQGTNGYQVTYTETLDDGIDVSATYADVVDLGILVSTFEVTN